MANSFHEVRLPIGLVTAPLHNVCTPAKPHRYAPEVYFSASGTVESYDAPATNPFVSALGRQVWANDDPSLLETHGGSDVTTWGASSAVRLRRIAPRSAALRSALVENSSFVEAQDRIYITNPPRARRRGRLRQQDVARPEQDPELGGGRTEELPGTPNRVEKTEIPTSPTPSRRITAATSTATWSPTTSAMSPSTTVPRSRSRRPPRPR